MSNQTQEPEMPAAISTETLNEWAQATFDVPTFNQLAPEQIDVFDQERNKQWQAYREHQQQQWQLRIARITESILNPQPRNADAKPTNPRQAQIDEWIAAGNSQATIKQKLDYFDKLDANKQAEQAKAESREQRQALKKALIGIDDKLLHPNTSRTEKAELLKQRFEIANQLKQ
jgi:hypothetical protein